MPNRHSGSVGPEKQASNRRPKRSGGLDALRVYGPVFRPYSLEMGRGASIIGQPFVVGLGGCVGPYSWMGCIPGAVHG